jgi:PAS domain S-box-containing protein
MEEQVKESEERYRVMIELGTEAGEAIVMLQDIDGKEGIQTFFNKQWTKITGYRKQELLGTPFFNLVSPHDRQTAIDWHHQKISGKTVPRLYEIRIMRKDGTAVDIELTGALTTYKDNRANVAYIRDITGRKKGELEIRRSEELYRGLFQNVPVAIAEDDYSQLKIYFDKLRANGVTDIRKFFTSAQNKPSNGKPWVQMTKVNDKALRLWDVTSVEEYINSFSQKHGDHIGIDGHTECLIGLAEGKTHFDYEELVRTVKGNWKHLHTWVSVAPGL